MLSYKSWKEELDLSKLMFTLDNSPLEPEKPALSNFRGFIKDQTGAVDGRLQRVKEFIGDLASHPKATERLNLLDSHEGIRNDVMRMSSAHWDALEQSLEALPPKEHQRMGHALRWLHMHMKKLGSKYDRKENNLGQWASRFKNPKMP